MKNIWKLTASAVLATAITWCSENVSDTGNNSQDLLQADVTQNVSEIITNKVNTEYIVPQELNKDLIVKAEYGDDLRNNYKIMSLLQNNSSLKTKKDGSKYVFYVSWEAFYDGWPTTWESPLLSDEMLPFNLSIDPSLHQYKISGYKFLIELQELNQEDFDKAIIDIQDKNAYLENIGHREERSGSLDLRILLENYYHLSFEEFKKTISETDIFKYNQQNKEIDSTLSMYADNHEFYHYTNYNEGRIEVGVNWYFTIPQWKKEAWEWKLMNPENMKYLEEDNFRKFAYSYVTES